MCGKDRGSIHETEEGSFITLTPDSPLSTMSGMAILEIHNLRKSFTAPDGEESLILDINHFALDEGAQVALEGSSGSGKTTLLHLIAGILTPSSGSVILNGKDLTSLSEPERDRWRATHTGYIFQTFNLLQAYTALENVELGMMFGKGIDTHYAKELLARMGLSHRMDYRPNQLSVGQQQRVALARALANHPSLVLADEPTGNLDPHHTGEALNLIRETCLEQGTALLLVSHDQQILRSFGEVRSLADINRAIGNNGSTTPDNVGRTPS